MAVRYAFAMGVLDVLEGIMGLVVAGDFTTGIKRGSILCVF